jgi:hypothetical protein
LPACDTTEGIQQYVDRLVSIFQQGLYLSVPDTADVLRSVNPDDVALPHLPCICFTELRMRDAVHLAKDYGRMGIGFRREYLMKHGANPVFYLPSGRFGIVNTNMSQLSQLVKPQFSSAADVILAYCKPMNRICDEQLVYYEEHEWRIVQAPAGIPLPSEFTWDDSHARMSFRFDTREVQVIVFPSAEVRAKVIANELLRNVFKVNMPMMLDYDACLEL